MAQTIKEYLDGIPENIQSDDGTTLKEAMADICYIWTNEACIGYCILAMQQCGFKPEQIAAVRDELWQQFDFVSVEDAEQAKQNFKG